MLDVTIDSVFSFTIVKKSERFALKHSNKGFLDLEHNRYRNVYKHAFSPVQTRYDKYKRFPIKFPCACFHAHVVVIAAKSTTFQFINGKINPADVLSKC